MPRFVICGGWQVLCEYNGSDEFQQWYAYGNYIDEVLAMGTGIFASTARFYIHDHLYSPAALTDYSGNVLVRYEYDAYGNPTIFNADFTTERESSNYGNPYLFTGRRTDYLDSGSLKIQYSRNRYYDYYTGRWLTKDPLGITPNPQETGYLGSGPQGSQRTNFASIVKNYKIGRVSEVDVPLLFLSNARNLANPIVVSQSQFSLVAPQIRQYADGMSLYEYTRSNPANYLDAFGTNIYVLPGTGWIPHRRICVDVWKVTLVGGIPVFVKAGNIRCFAYRKTGYMLSGPKKTWLGWKEDVLCACYKGRIYEDVSTKTGVLKEKATNAIDDVWWLNYMVTTRVNTEDIYNPATYNCFKYAKLEFEDAPGVEVEIESE